MKVVAEAIRSQTLWLWNIQVRKKDKIKDDKKFWEYTWDKKDKQYAKAQTKKQMINAMKSIASITYKPKKKKNA